MTVRFEGVSFTYPEADRPAIDRLDFEAATNAVNLVTGPLGAGASTLILLAAGVAPRHTQGQRMGNVLTLGTDPAAEEGVHSLSGRVATLLPRLSTQLSGMAFTVWDEVAFAPANLGWSRDRITTQVNEALSWLDVQHLARRDPNTLSGGELQRALLAGALVLDPDVLLLDEPTHELDPEGAESFYDLLPSMAERTTVIVATTDVDRAFRVADRVLILDNGRCVAKGDPQQVFSGAAAADLEVSPILASLFHGAGFAAPYPLGIDEARAWIRA